MKKLVDMQISAIAGVDNPANKRKWLIIKRADLSKSEFSYENKRQILASAIKSKLNYTDTSNPGGLWVRDVYDSYFVYETDSKLFKVSYILDKNGKATLTEPEEVIQETEYISVTKGGEIDLKNLEASISKIGRTLSGANVAKIKDMITMMQGLIEEKGMDMKGSDNMPLTKEQIQALPEDVQKYITEQESELVIKAELVDDLTKKVEELTPNEEVVDIWKGVDPVIRKQFEDMKEKAESAEKIAKAEQDARIQRDFEDKASQYPHMGKTEEVAKMLRSAYDIDEDNGKALEETFKSSNAKIEASNLMKEIGANSQDSGADSMAKIEAMADEMIEKGAKLTREQAISKVMKTEEGAKLYAQYSQENRYEGSVK